MTHKTSSTPRGFTLVELAVVIVMTMIVVGGIIGFMIGATNQFTASATRSQLTTQLTNASNRLENDVRYARFALEDNSVDDAATPPSDFWHSNAHQLVLGATSRDSSFQPLGGDPTDYTDILDNIVYYLANGNLYRRYLADPTTGNRYSTTTCTPPLATGGCADDTLIANHVKSFTLTYYDKAGTATTTVGEAASIQFELTLEATQSHQTITVNGTTRTALLSTPLVASADPGSEPADPSAPPAIDYSAWPSLGAGYGGVSFSWNAGGMSAYGLQSLGKIKVDVTAGEVKLSPKIYTTNSGCGSSSSYPTICSGAGVTNNSAAGEVSATTICSQNGTVTSGWGISGTKTSSCTLPPGLPTVDKAGLVASIPAANTSSSVSSCSSYASNWHYTGNVSLSGCTLTLAAGSVTYIEGTLSLGSGSVVLKNSSSQKATIIVNRQITTSGSVTLSGNIDLISMYSSSSSCYTSSSCNSVSNSVLYSSSSLDAIKIPSNLTLTGAPRIFSPFARISIGTGSNNITIKTSNDSKIIGQTLLIGSGANLLSWNDSSY